MGLNTLEYDTKNIFSVCFVFINDSASFRGSQSFCFVTVLIPGNMYARIFQGLIARSNVCELK